MHGNLPAEAQREIFFTDQSVSEKLSGGGPQTITDLLVSESCEWFSKLARKLWRDKPAVALEFLTGAPERQCYRYTSERPQEPPGKIIARLLRSSDGARVLDEIMRGSQAEWWKRHRFALAALPFVEQLRQLELPLE
jgi:hypothetical protein